MRTITLERNTYVLENKGDDYCIHGVVADGLLECTDCAWLVDNDEAPEPEEE